VGLKGWFKSSNVFDKEVDVQETLLKQFYFEGRRLHPRKEHHEHLAVIWLSRMLTEGDDISNQANAMIKAMSCTAEFACIPPKNALKAMSFYIFCKHNENSLKQNEFSYNQALESKAKVRYGIFLSAINDAKRNGTIFNIYADQNPILAIQLQAIIEEDSRYQFFDYINLDILAEIKG
jgi:hypothetical protein